MKKLNESLNRMRFLMEYKEGILMREFDETRKNIFVLVGPPSVGKSTWIRNHFGDDNPYIINRDDIFMPTKHTDNFDFAFNTLDFS